MPELPHLQVVEQVPGLDILLFPRAEHLEIVPYPDVVPDALPVQKPQPFLSHELPVRQEAVNTVPSEPGDEIPDKGDALPRVGVSALVQHAEAQGERHISIGHPQHQYVDASSPRASSWCGPSPAPGAPLRAGAQK